MRIRCELHVFHLKSPQAAPIIDCSMERLEGAARGSEITDLAADVANDPAEPGAQDAQLSLMPLELFGIGVPARHHRGGLGHTRIGLPQRGPCLLARRLSPLIAACRSLASVGKAMTFGCTVVSTVTRLRS